jgi:methionyl-tRNA formyltransferase
MRILFFGTPDFAVPGLRALLDIPSAQIIAVVTQPDRPAGRGGSLRMSPVKELALSKGIPVLQPRSIKKELVSFIATLRELGPCDVGVVIAFGQILPIEVLSFPDRGCINVHASLLPRWRGAAPIHRAVLAGDKETGVCLMAMNEGLDTGAVYVSATTPILRTDTTGTLHDSLALQGAELLRSHLAAIVDGSLTAIPQPTIGETYARKIGAEESVIDWMLGSAEIERTIRAFNPVPGAHTVWHGKRLKVFRAVSLENDRLSAAPGAVTNVLPDRFEVATGSGVLRIYELQLEGKRRLSAAEFLNGNQTFVGDTFG